MKIVMFAAQKGGGGKSTLAASLAVAAMQTGERVILVDLDAQASLSVWHEDRRTDDFVLRQMEPVDFGTWVAQARNVAGVSLVVVDTPGRDGPDLGLAYAHADLCLVPALPSVLDVRAAAPTVRRLDDLRRPFAFVLNGVNKKAWARTEDATAALKVAGVVAPLVGSRLVFRDAFASGLGVTEFAPTSQAAIEVRDLWAWIKSRLTGGYDVAA